MATEVADNDLLDYEEEDQAEAGGDTNGTNGTTKKEVKGAYVSIHSSGFRDFLLKPELLYLLSIMGSNILPRFSMSVFLKLS